MWQKNRVVIAQHAKIITGLEISKCQQKLLGKLVDFVSIFALGLIMTKQTQDGNMDDGMKLSCTELPTKAAYNPMTDTPTKLANSLAFPNLKAPLRVFAIQQQFDKNTIEDKIVQPDNHFLKNPTNSLNSWVPNIIMKL